MRQQLISSLLVTTILASAITAVVLTAGAIPSAAIFQSPVQIVVDNETVSPSPTPTPTPTTTPTPTPAVNPVYPFGVVEDSSPTPSATVTPTPAAFALQENQNTGSSARYQDLDSIRWVIQRPKSDFLPALWAPRW